ncbi:hypothetical protein KKG41_01085 [Patescibacteria group bacterium]|nr:hypothetical protein [Patescibacteria group bacterium]
MIEALLDKAIVLCSQLQGTEEKSALLGHIEKFTKIYLTLSEGLKVLPKQKDKDDIDDIAKSKELSAYAFYKQAKKKSINMQPKNEKEETALLHKKIEEMEL